MHRPRVLLASSIAALVCSAASPAAAATPQYYTDLMSFQTDVTFTVTDDYSNPGYLNFNTNAQMTAVLGETEYMTTGFMNLNIVGGATYCAGCNGSFLLTFTGTTVGNDEGVNGVGLYILSNDFMNPYYAYITFADGDTEDIVLPGGSGFWGVFAPERIESIHFGLSGGGATMGGYFQIDDLIVGDGFDMTPCGDGITTPDEDCDDMGETASCDGNCTFADCGDGQLNITAGEVCDDMGESPTCNDDCTASSCGDGVVNLTAGEDCDEMGETATCNGNCTIPVCGDGQPNPLAGEECDDSAESPACDPDCTLPSCGDGYENNTAGEYCDDGNTDDGDGCSSTCTIEEVESTSSSSSESGGTSDSGASEGGETTAADESSSEGGVLDTSGADESSGGASATGSVSVTATGSESEGDESSGGASGSGGSNDDGGGCGCSTDDPKGLTGSILALAAVLVRRRRYQS